MAYEALLFCPDEKTARTVTQVLAELEFGVEPCTEPFAAVKKLMSQHFDAIVVDCDNEQNATLLFKSARNSTSNQASLAVAIVEGQAGVAKAFRIGANLVLTKPINVEQSKGTLRVARGLLRKGEPGKPAAAPQSSAAAAPGVAPATSAAAPASPAKPLATRPLSATKPAVPAVSATRPPLPVRPPLSPAARPTIPAAPAKPTTSPAPAIAASTENVAAVTPAAPIAASVTTPAFAPSTPAAKPASVASARIYTSLSSGAASAPAPAREPELSSPELAASAPEIKPGTSEQPVKKSAEPSEAIQIAAPRAEAPTTFTFGGANVAEPSAGAGKKAILGIVAAIVLAVGAYAGWTYFQSHNSQSPAKTTLPAAITPKPQSASKPVAPESEAASSVSRPESKELESTPPSTSDAESDESLAEKPAHPSKNLSKPSASPAVKNPPAADAENAAPLVVKRGSEPAVHSSPVAPDATAPSVIGIGAPSSTGALSSIVGDEKTAKPVLQAMKISQGVAQGLIIKRVAPEYPRNALLMHIEGAVELAATISKDGAITDVKVLKGDPQLSHAALQAVKQWKYKPYLLNGEPVEIQTQITVNFDLPR